jgi:hypothetical protein
MNRRIPHVDLSVGGCRLLSPANEIEFVRLFFDKIISLDKILIEILRLAIFGAKSSNIPGIVRIDDNLTSCAPVVISQCAAAENQAESTINRNSEIQLAPPPEGNNDFLVRHERIRPAHIQ